MSSYEPTVFGGTLPPGVEPTPNADKPARIYLTKREQFAAMAMQGMMAGFWHPTRVFDCQEVAKDALSCADALLKELGK